MTRRNRNEIREHDSKFTEHLLLSLLCGATGQATTMQPGKKITAELDYDKDIKPYSGKNTHSWSALRNPEANK